MGLLMFRYRITDDYYRTLMATPADQPAGTAIEPTP